MLANWLLIIIIIMKLSKISRLGAWPTIFEVRESVDMDDFSTYVGKFIDVGRIKDEVYLRMYSPDKYHEAFCFSAL